MTLLPKQYQDDLIMAKASYEKMIALARQQKNDDTIQFARLLCNYAEVLDLLEQFNEAKRTYENAIKIINKKHDKENSDIIDLAMAYDGLAHVLCNQNQHQVALKYLIKAKNMIDDLSYKSTELYDYDQDKAKLLSTLTEIYYSLDRLDDALETAEMALKLIETSHNMDDMDKIVALDNYALLSKEVGHWEKSIEAIREILRIKNKYAELNKMLVPISSELNNLGSIYFQQAKYDDAIRCYLKAIEEDKKHYGENNIEIAVGYHNLGMTYEIKGDYDRAKELYEKAFVIDQAHYDPTHSIIIADIISLANINFNIGNIEVAESMIKDALNRKKKSGDDNPFEMASILSNLAIIISEKDPQKAEDLYDDALNKIKIGKKTGTAVHADVMINFAKLLCKRGKLTKAERLCRDSLSIYTKHIGTDHPSFAQALCTLGMINSANNKPKKEIMSLYNWAHDVLEKKLGLNHPYVADIEKVINDLPNENG